MTRQQHQEAPSTADYWVNAVTRQRVEATGVTLRGDPDPDAHVVARYGHKRQLLSGEPGQFPHARDIDNLWTVIGGSRNEAARAVQKEWPRLREEWKAERRRAVLAVVDALGSAVTQDALIQAHRRARIRPVHES